MVHKSYIHILAISIVFTEILAVLSSKPEGSTDWRIKQQVTLLDVHTPQGVKRLAIAGVKDPNQLFTSSDGTAAKAVMCGRPDCPNCQRYASDIDSGILNIYYWLTKTSF